MLHLPSLYCIKSTRLKAAHAFDALILINDGHLFFLPGNGIGRAPLETKSTALAGIWVHFKLHQIRTGLCGTGLIIDMGLKFIPEIP